jgi:hypothetical protein
MPTHTRTHVLVGFANPFFRCNECKQPVPYWHNPERCDQDCNYEFFNAPCGHQSDIYSICPTWDPVEGCTCTNKETHDEF